MIRLHEILEQNLPVEVAVPMLLPDQLCAGQFPFANKLLLKSAVAFGHTWPFGVEFHENKPLPDFATVFVKAYFASIKVRRFLHFRNSNKFAAQIITPEMVGTKYDSLIAVIRRGFLWHQVHPPMSAHARQHSDFIVLPTSDQQRLTANVNPNKIARIRNL